MSARGVLPSRSLWAAALGALLALPGCKGCRSERPYTPFGVASSLPIASASAAPAPSASVEAPVFTEKTSTPAKKGETRFRLGEREVEVTAGRVFDQVLISDLDENGKDDAVAFTLPAPGRAAEASPGEFVFYPDEGEARTLFEWPTFLPSGPSCSGKGSLVQRSPRTVVADLSATCSTQLVARAPTRIVALLEPAVARSFLFGVRAADPAPGEALLIEPFARDADKDGRPDPALRIGVSASGAEAGPFVQFDWFDRPAGLSRDARLPSRALVQELDAELVRAQRKKSSARALARLESLRRALFSACAESGTPRLFTWEGAPLRCEPTPDLVDRMTALEVTARLTEGDHAGAVGALSRDGWYFGAVRPQRRVALVTEIEKRLPVIPVTTSVLDVVPKLGTRPHFSPLDFTADGALMIQTDTGVVQVARGGDRVTPLAEPAGILPWPLDVQSGGERLTSVVYSCDRSELQLLLTGATTRLLPTTLLSPRPGVCTGASVTEPIPTAPIGASPEHVAVVTAGTRVQSGPVDRKSGSALSQNGANLAISTTFGLIIRGERTEHWGVDGWAVLPGNSCVVSNDARRAACLRGNRTELYTR